MHPNPLCHLEKLSAIAPLPDAKMLHRCFNVRMSDQSCMKRSHGSLAARKKISSSGRLLFTNPLNMSSRVQWCTCLFIRPFYGPLHVLDVAHLHNNETHLRPANNSAALHSIAKSWFPNLVQPTHRPPTRSLPCRQLICSQLRDWEGCNLQDKIRKHQVGGEIATKKEDVF